MKILPICLFFTTIIKSQNVFISGKLNNYNLETIPFFKKDYTTFKDIHIPIKNFTNNYFEAEFKNPKPQLFKLFLNWVFIEPSDTVQFNFSFVDVSPTEFYDSINVKGKYPGNYTYYKTFKNWLTAKPVYETQVSHTAESFYQSLRSFYFTTLTARIDHFARQNPLSKNFYKYIVSELHIKFLADLLQTLKTKKVRISKQLYVLIEKEINLSGLKNESFLDSPDYVNFGYLYLEYFLQKNNKITSNIENYLWLKKLIDKQFRGILRDFWMSLLVRSQYFNKPAIYVAKEDSLTNTILISLTDSSIRKSLSSFVFTYSNRNEEAVRGVQLINLDNKIVTLDKVISNDTGFVKVIDFWASWCIPCIKENKKLDELKVELKNLRVIRISVDKIEDDWRNAIKRHGYSLERQYLIQSTEEKKMTSLINLESIPRFLIVTKKGRIIFFQAFSPSNKKELLQQLQYASTMDEIIMSEEKNAPKGGPPKPVN